MPKEAPILVTPLEPLDIEPFKESINIMSSEWVEEGEHSSEEIQIHVPPSTICCKVLRIMLDVLYSPTIRANLMSVTFASTYFGNEPLALTIKSLRNNPWSILKGHEILHNTTIHHDDAVMALDFPVFDI